MTQTCTKCLTSRSALIDGLCPHCAEIVEIKEIPTDKYKYCNHHHEIGDHHEMVDFGDGKFVANKEAIPLLKALNEIGLKTRSHHIDCKPHAWICILMDNVEIEIKEVSEQHADRDKYNGKKELLLTWKK